jgi:ribosomal protein S18 acetylase RimI-like enzyme
MQRPENLLLVAEDNNRIIAYLTLEQSSEDATKHVCDLGILVHPFYRQQGLGRWLIELAQKQAAVMKYEKIILSVFHNNQPAINTYKKLGFVEVGRRKQQFKIKDEYIDEILMDYFVEI